MIKIPLEDLSLIGLKAKLVTSGSACSPHLSYAEQSLAVMHPKTHLLPLWGCKPVLSKASCGFFASWVFINISVFHNNQLSLKETK